MQARRGVRLRFLLPVGGITDHRFGILTSPGHKGVPVGIRDGMKWAADNGVYSGTFDAENYVPWLQTMQEYAETCLFVLAPDVVGDAVATLEQYKEWEHTIKEMGFPVGFAAQDGSENIGLPAAFDALFVGGTTRWKLSAAALSVIQRAQRMSKHIHIGRVNAWKRYAFFRGLPGSESWTCDGTRTRFDGTEKTVKLWAKYQRQAYTRRLELT